MGEVFDTFTVMKYLTTPVLLSLSLFFCHFVTAGNGGSLKNKAAYYADRADFNLIAERRNLRVVYEAGFGYRESNSQRNRDTIEHWGNLAVTNNKRSQVLRNYAILEQETSQIQRSHILSASINCGSFICHGSSAYCCFLSDGTYGCCWDTFVYQLWWFWLIWIVVFFLILGCSLACWRHRRAQYRYVVMANSEYPSYGTVVHSNYGAPVGTPYATAPTGPPSYDAAQASKPPPYST